MRTKISLLSFLTLFLCAPVSQAVVIYDFAGLCNSGQGCNATSPVPVTGVLTLNDGYANPLEVSDIVSFVYTNPGVATFTFVPPPEGSGELGIISASGNLPAVGAAAATSIIATNSPFQTLENGNWDLFVGAGANFSNEGIDGTWTQRVVPVPAAVWLFSSGLLGLIGIARRKKA